MSQSWKKYGSIKNLDSMNHLNVNSITTNEFNIRKAYQGTFKVEGEIFGTNNASIDKSITVKENIIGQNDLQLYENIIMGNPDQSEQTQFIASNSNGIGLNVDSPQAILDISGSYENAINVYSNSERTYSVLAQNKNRLKILLE